MKKLKQLFAFATILCMLFALAACGSNNTNSAQGNNDSSANTENTAPTTPADSTDTKTSLAGTYNFDYTDVYGDITTITVTLKDDSSFNLMTRGAMGNGVYSGTQWSDNGDSTVTTGATDNTLGVDWADADGSVTWAIDGSGISPVGYEVPTEFLEKAAFADPTTGAEAVGIYTFGEVNDHGSTVPYVVWVNANGTYTVYMNNSFTGLHAYSGDSWIVNSESVVSFGPATYEGDDPMGSWFDADNGFSSSWVLHGDGTCEPVGYTGSSAAVDTAELPEEIYPAGAEHVGVYTFGEVNDHGSTVPYVFWFNADGTANIYMNNAFTGLHEYDGEWTYDGDGVISVGTLTYEGDDPMGAWFDTDNGYASSYTVNNDGTVSPAGYTGSSAAVDTASLPAEIYPTFSSLAGTYYFGEVNDHGSTVPYAVVLKADNNAMVLMDNSFTGVHTYTGEWTDNGDGTISIGALTYEGDAPMGSWFNADDGFSSSWQIGAGTCSPVGYTGSSASVSGSDFSEAAIAEINAF